MAPAIARGNTVVMIPSQRFPLSATDFYQVLDTSDVPGGVVNIVTGDREHLTKTLVQHEDVDAVWYFCSAEGSYKGEGMRSVSFLGWWASRFSKANIHCRKVWLLPFGGHRTRSEAEW